MTVETTEDNHQEIARPLKAKHPLQHKWAFWFLKGDRTKEWEECLKKIVVIENVEDFWGIYLQVVPASGLSFGSDYYLFKDGVKPMWEDPQNVRGGRWVVQVDKQSRRNNKEIKKPLKSNTKLDELWLELMMAIIGEQFENHGAYICGAAVNLRQKGDKVALWTSDASLDDSSRRIGMIFRNKLGLQEENIRYEVHKDASNRTGSLVKPKFVIEKEKQQALSEEAEKQ